MHALVVVAHPDPRSLTHAIATQLAQAITASSAKHSVEIADLAAEGFDPRFNQTDLDLFAQRTGPTADIVAEQARVDRADALALVYPIYWWSFPALLKGWIDRVFSNGWAYQEHPDGSLEKKLNRLPVHLLGIGAANPATYARHGYAEAMRTQIDHGIFDFCGARVQTSELLLPENADSAQAHLEIAKAIGERIFPAR